MKKIIAIVLLLAFACLFIGCAPKTDEAVSSEKMEEKGYIVTIDDSFVPSLIYVQTDVKPIYLMTAKKGSDMVYTIAFNNKTDAETAKEYVTTWAKKQMSGAEVKQSGAWLYFGTEQAVKDFK